MLIDRVERVQYTIPPIQRAWTIVVLWLLATDAFNTGFKLENLLMIRLHWESVQVLQVDFAQEKYLSILLEGTLFLNVIVSIICKYYMQIVSIKVNLIICIRSETVLFIFIQQLVTIH